MIIAAFPFTWLHNEAKCQRPLQFTKSRRVRRVTTVGGFYRCEGLAVIVQSRRLEDDAERAHETRRGEDPKEQAVQHHGHVLPVFDNLEKRVANVNVSVICKAWSQCFFFFLRIWKTGSRGG